MKLELTPPWWRMLVERLNSNPESAPERALLAQALGIAFELPLSQSVHFERMKLEVVVVVSPGATLENLALAAGKCRERMGMLDITCLGN